ncbi:hypothetical protein NM688_g8676 [Phlebia brevispora]|uniref:Uncharacterized protein n=1 Tax=Phlebia brevispora TaxID=194682 RepID=A0ACC1RQF1_9APHY|nr:hypothetical protein NM688_g8676 [Phlebia brevispora]
MLNPNQASCTLRQAPEICPVDDLSLTLTLGNSARFYVVLRCSGTTFATPMLPAENDHSVRTPSYLALVYDRGARYGIAPLLSRMPRCLVSSPNRTAACSYLTTRPRVHSREYAVVMKGRVPLCGPVRSSSSFDADSFLSVGDLEEMDIFSHQSSSCNARRGIRHQTKWKQNGGKKTADRRQPRYILKNSGAASLDDMIVGFAPARNIFFSPSDIRL